MVYMVQIYQGVQICEVAKSMVRAPNETVSS